MTNVERLFERFKRLVGTDTATRYTTHTGCIWVSRAYSFEVFSESAERSYNEHAIITCGDMIVDDAIN